MLAHLKNLQPPPYGLNCGGRGLASCYEILLFNYGEFFYLVFPTGCLGTGLRRFQVNQLYRLSRTRIACPPVKRIVLSQSSVMIGCNTRVICVVFTLYDVHIPGRLRVYGVGHCKLMSRMVIIVSLLTYGNPYQCKMSL